MYLPRSRPGILRHTVSYAICAALYAASTSARLASAISANAFFGGRIDRIEILARLRRDELAADEQLVARLDLRVGGLGRGIVLPEIAEDQLGIGARLP